MPHPSLIEVELRALIVMLPGGAAGVESRVARVTVADRALAFAAMDPTRTSYSAPTVKFVKVTLMDPSSSIAHVGMSSSTSCVTSVPNTSSWLADRR